MSALIERGVSRVIENNREFARVHPSAAPLVHEENLRLMCYIVRERGGWQTMRSAALGVQGAAMAVSQQ
jgi:hypothetical protein